MAKRAITAALILASSFGHASADPTLSLPSAATAPKAPALRMMDWDDGWTRFRKQASSAHSSIQGETWTALPDSAKESILRMEFRTLQEHGIGSANPMPGGIVTTGGALPPK